LNSTIPPAIQFNNNQYDLIFTIGITGTSPLISTILDVSFESFNSSYWDNLIQEDEIIYVDITWGHYNMSFTFDNNTDVNLDGTWDVTDIILTIQYILIQIELEPVQIENADLNDDNNVDILDVIAMVNLII
tara:strand:- start:93 stop:488 length:396 start_codon:yes stop_codon:yes gene_type:complete